MNKVSDAKIQNGKDKDDSKIIIPSPVADILSLVRSLRRSHLNVATFAWSEHQSGRGDPKEKDEDFGGDASNGVGGAAAGKWV
ncbi:MAG: hypothetical protein Q9180_007243 [Flavoplaca navasiana]